MAVPIGVWQVTSAVAVVTLAVFAWVLARTVRKLRDRETLAEERERFSALFEDGGSPMVVVDHDGRMESANPAFMERHATLAEGLRGRAITSIFSGSSRSSVLGAVRTALNGSARKSEATFVNGESRLDVELTTVPLRHEGEIVGSCVYIRDITNRKQLEQELHSRALHDYLTGLPNRALFQDRLEHALHRVERSGESVTLLYMDLDRFKPVNDRLGHEVGDRVLEKVAVRLKALVRGGDTVARVGGDEFAILIETACEPDEALASANRAVAAVREEFEIEDELITIGASVGIAISDAEVASPADLVRRADLAMYEAKKRGGFQVYAYHPELEEEHDGFGERIESELRKALKLGELHVVYQPIVDVDGESLWGLEALVRWNHAEFGQVYPSQFIPIAEESSLIATLDRWVLETACREIKELFADWDQKVMLSVNLSARHFSESDFISAVSDIILDTGFDPDRLQLEITETAAGGDADRVRRLKALGVKVAIDDFGSGYSSLGYLRELDVDVLKVDRSFVLALGADPSSVAIVRTIITLAEILDLEVIIEGIEDNVQLGYLEELGGRYVQGYLWGRPLKIDALPEIFRDGVRRLDSVDSDSDSDGAGLQESRPYLAPVGGRANDDGVADLNRVRVR
ncbi:MAG: EAL domain-containing protein [Gemmatimonadota bacterium]|nr:EAL domain-containing protein [Gemmatimonadota bacterium]